MKTIIIATKLVCAVLALFCTLTFHSTAALADPLDPNAFASLGALNFTSGTLTINTDTATMSGAAAFTGVFQPQANFPIAVFDFSSISIGSGATVIITGVRPLGLLSRGNGSILAPLSVSAGNLTGNPGSGGFPGGYSSGAFGEGFGPGGGTAYYSYLWSGPRTAILGGGFGGNGGSVSSGTAHCAGGSAYGNLLTELVGGSGGAQGGANGATGGGGGGAIEIGTVGSLALGSVTSNGGNIVTPINSWQEGAPGSGGGVLIHAGGGLSWTGTLSANGGVNNVPNTFGYFVTGGGGGRIAMLGIPSYTIGSSPTGSYSVSGGSSVNDSRLTPGNAGVITVGANATIVPSGRSIVLDGNPIISIPGSTTQTTPTVEAVIQRDLAIDYGALVTLGAANVLNGGTAGIGRGARLEINGSFDLAGFNQTVGSLWGTPSGQLRIPAASTLSVGMVGAVFGMSYYNGSIIGSGTIILDEQGYTMNVSPDQFQGHFRVRDGQLTLTDRFSAASIELTSTTSSLVISAISGLSGNLTANIGGGGSLTKVNGGTVTVSGNNTYTGTTRISEGILRVGGGSALGNGSAVMLENTAGATLDLDGNTVTIGSLAGGGSLGGSVLLGIGTLVVGSNNASTSFNGAINGSGALNKIGGGNLTLSGTVAHTGATTITAGTLTVAASVSAGGGAVVVQPGATLAAQANIARAVQGNGASSNIVAATNNISLGSSSSFTGFSHAGTLTVGTNTVTINSKGLAALGALTSLAGGQINAPNGISLGGGGNLVGSGTVNARIAAYTGSAIYASGGNLILGNAVSPVGIACDGELYTDVNVVTLRDSNQAVLGSLTQVGDGLGSSGTLAAANGLLVDFGRNLVGQGYVQSANTLTKAVIINGSVQGDGTGLEFTGYVKGVGTFAGTTIFDGTYSPGLSPASVSLESMTLRPTSTLLVELGGKTAGSQYDVVNLSGTGALDGTLQVSLLSGFVPAHNDQFTVMNFAARSGQFGNGDLNLGSRLLLMPDYTANSLVLTAVQGGPGTWQGNGGGPASVPGNWANGLPNGAGDVATFGAAISQSATVNFDVPTTLGGIVLQNNHSYTLAGPSAVTLQASGGSATIDVVSGDHSVSAPLVLAGNLTINGSGSLTLSGSVSDGGLGKSLRLNGPGTLVISGTTSYTGGTTVAAGTLILTSANALADGTSLTVGDDSLFLTPVVPAAVISSTQSATAVPEPGTLTLSCVAALALLSHSWRRRRHPA